MKLPDPPARLMFFILIRKVKQLSSYGTPIIGRTQISPLQFNHFCFIVALITEQTQGHMFSRLKVFCHNRVCMSCEQLFLTAAEYSMYSQPKITPPATVGQDFCFLTATALQTVVMPMRYFVKKARP